MPSNIDDDVLFYRVTFQATRETAGYKTLIEIKHIYGSGESEEVQEDGYLELIRYFNNIEDVYEFIMISQASVNALVDI